MKPIYTKLAADGSELPADHPNEGPEKHMAVRVHWPELGVTIIAAAYRALPERVEFSEVRAACEGYAAYDWKWRAPTVEELFLIADRTRSDERLDPNFFPDAEDWEPTWSSDVDAESPSGFAWIVGLGGGDASGYGQAFRFRVRAVRSGQ